MTYELPNGKTVDKICMPCRAGMHGLCAYDFDDELEEGEDCCCWGQYSIRDHTIAMLRDEVAEDQLLIADGPDGPGPTPTAPKGDSGYIHPDAWRGSKNIGEYTEPQSTGRKTAHAFYPIPQGYVCEWAGLAAAGGGVNPIVGCMGYPAQDTHHGPDKNTLNNEKGTWGRGERENVHLICSWCHNTWHGANDRFYPKTGANGERDYVRDQATPFIPTDPTITLLDHDPVTKATTPRVYDLSEGRGRQGKIRQGEDDDDQ